jgi:hypothetical protein
MWGKTHTAGLGRRLRPSGAIIVAVLALVLSLGGTALAVKHYLITSTKQIKPTVLAKLRGHRGPRGPMGPPGQNGKNGTNGKNGAVAGYYANAAEADFTNQAAATVVTKTLPAGSFVVHGDVFVDASQSPGTAVGVRVVCNLGAVGTSQSRTFTAVFNSRADDTTTGTLSFDLAGSQTAPGAATIDCTDYSGQNGAQGGDTGTLHLGAALTAVQTAANS